LAAKLPLPSSQQQQNLQHGNLYLRCFASTGEGYKNIPMLYKHNYQTSNSTEVQNSRIDIPES